MKTLRCLLLTLWMASSALAASPLPGGSDVHIPIVSTGDGPRFCLDYCNFQGVDNKTYVEFYVQVSYSELQFIKHKDRFKAGYHLKLTILDEFDQVVETQETNDQFQVDSFAETVSTQKARASLMAFTLKPTTYRVKALVRDLETMHATRIEQELQLGDFRAPNLLMSDIQLSSKIEPGEDGQPYVKNSRYILPNASRIFAHGLNESIFIYFEVYNLLYDQLKPQATYTTRFTFLNGDGEPIASFARTHPKPGPTSAHSMKFPLSYFPNGNYKLIIQTRDDATGQTCESVRDFSVLDWSIALSEENLHLWPR